MISNEIYVSVVIPMYNGGDNITRCLSCLDRQTAEIPFEVLIVDDKSTDNSVQIVEQTIASFRNHERFRLIKCEKNGRAGKARNTGIKNARGTYVLFIDQDDYPDERLIEQLYKLTENGTYDMVSCAVLDKTGEIYYRPELNIRTALSDGIKNDLCGNYGFVFASLIRRETLIKNDIRFPEQLMFEDALFNEGVIASIDSIRTTGEVLYYREEDENSQTTELTVKKLSDRIDATMQYVDQYSDNPGMAKYMESIRQAAFFYVFLSCMRWILMYPELYDKSLISKSLNEGKRLNVDWKSILKKEKRIKKKYLYILKSIYDRPVLFELYRHIYSVRRAIRKHK